MAAIEPLLKTQQVALALGVSASSVKRWADSGTLRATRTVGNHRLVSLTEAIRFARKHGLPVAGLEALATEALPGPTEDGSLDQLPGLLLAGDAPGARSILLEAHARLGGALPLADDLIRPVMERIGHGWMIGSIEVYQEHQASQVIASAVTELIAQTPAPPKSAPLALGAGPEGDHYTLSLLLAELALREHGWNVRNLGPHLPSTSLAGAVLEYRPKLVFLSINHLADADRFRREYRLFQQSAAAVGAAVVIGGRAVVPALRASLIHDSSGDRLAHLVEFARRLAPTAPEGSGDEALSLEPIFAPNGSTNSRTETVL